MPAHLNLTALSAALPEPIGYWNCSQFCDLSYQRKADGMRSVYFQRELIVHACAQRLALPASGTSGAADPSLRHTATRVAVDIDPPAC